MTGKGNNPIGVADKGEWQWQPELWSEWEWNDWK